MEQREAEVNRIIGSGLGGFILGVSLFSDIPAAIVGAIIGVILGEIRNIQIQEESKRRHS